jgi:hypothetical protein
MFTNTEKITVKVARPLEKVVKNGIQERLQKPLECWLKLVTSQRNVV